MNGGENGTPADGPTVVISDERSSNDSPDRVVDLVRWEHLAVSALRSEGAVGELALTFIDRADIADLNVEHMGKSSATDVLSFPMHDEPQPGVPILLGDVVLSPAVAGDQCDAHAGTYDDEIALLIVHGILHIIGHDHVDPDETATMRRRELDLLTKHHWVDGPPPGFRQQHDER